LVGRQVITVTDGNVDDVIFALTPASDITGTIQVDPPPQRAGQAAAPPRPRPVITLFSREGALAAPPGMGPSNPDGSFQMKNVAPGLYELNVGAMGQGNYVKAVRYGSDDVTGKSIEIAAGPGGKLEIHIASDGATLSGSVRDAQGNLVARAPVLLWEPGRESNRAKFTATATTGPNGGYRFGAIPPGRYRIAAWSDADSQVVASPEFREQFESQATEVNIDAQGQATADLKVIAKEAVDAAMAKLP
jgi:hypothetical protein